MNFSKIKLSRSVSQALIVFFALVATIPASVFAYAPSVQTYSVVRVEKHCAVVHGWVDPAGSNDTKMWFHWGTEDWYLKMNSKTDEFATIWRTSGTSAGEYYDTITGLSPDRVYYYRAVAQNSTGRSYGSMLSFRTKAGEYSFYEVGLGASLCRDAEPPKTPIIPITPVVPPAPTQSVATLNASAVLDNSAQLNAVAFPINGYSTWGWFEWGGTPDLGNITGQNLLGAGPSVSMAQVISGLKPGTTYFFRPVIQSAYGKSYGLLYSFRTSGVAPYVPPVTPVTPIIITTHTTTGGSNTNPVNSKPLVVSDESKIAAANLAAAASVGDGFLGLSFTDWMWILAHLFFVLGLFFLFLFLCCRKNQKEDTTLDADLNSEQEITPWMIDESQVPQQEPHFIQKSLPPANLPV